MLWFDGTDWFLNFSFLGTEMRELFPVHTYNVGVVVWVAGIPEGTIGSRLNRSPAELREKRLQLGWE